MNPASSPELLDHVLEDVTSMEYILLGDLRDLLEEPFDDVTFKWLTAVVDALLQTLPQEFSRQNDGGYLSEVVEEDPNWYRYVTQLAEERRAIFRRLCDVRQHLAATRDIEQIADELRNELRAWMFRITALHRHERRLLQTAFNLDVGTGD
jgi:hypothetical protein